MSKTGRTLRHETEQLRHNALIRFERLTAACALRFRGMPVHTRRGMIGTAVIIVLLLISALSYAHRGGTRDSGLAGCAALSARHHRHAPDYRLLRAEFAGSRWQAVRTAGVAYAELAAQLRRASYTDGYQVVWSYQRLAEACAPHTTRQPAR
jgi:hypothetical protein